MIDWQIILELLEAVGLEHGVYIIESRDEKFYILTEYCWQLREKLHEMYLFSNRTEYNNTLELLEPLAREEKDVRYNLDLLIAKKLVKEVKKEFKVSQDDMYCYTHEESHRIEEIGNICYYYFYETVEYLTWEGHALFQILSTLTKIDQNYNTWFVSYPELINPNKTNLTVGEAPAASLQRIGNTVEYRRPQ